MRCGTYPMPKVVCKRQIPSEGIGKGMIELQHLQQTASFDGVEVTVC